MGFNRKEKQAVPREYRPRYQKAAKKEKAAVLDEFTRSAATGNQPTGFYAANLSRT
jgi:hypothetical protein